MCDFVLFLSSLHGFYCLFFFSLFLLGSGGMAGMVRYNFLLLFHFFFHWLQSRSFLELTKSLSVFSLCKVIIFLFPCFRRPVQTCTCTLGALRAALNYSSQCDYMCGLRCVIIILNSSALFFPVFSAVLGTPKPRMNVKKETFYPRPELQGKKVKPERADVYEDIMQTLRRERDRKIDHWFVQILERNACRNFL